MRRIIAREGVVTVDGRLVVRGSLWWRDPCPLMRMPEEGDTVGHDGSRILGMVSDIRREPDWTITVELSHEIEGMAPEIDLDQVTWDTADDARLVVVSGRISAVTLGTRPVWDGLTLTG